MEIMHPGSRVVSRFHYPLTYLNSIEQFAKNFQYTSSSFSLASGPTSIDFELHLKKARPETLVVFLGGAKIQQDIGKVGPFFLARTFSKSLKANCLFISDPAFSYNPEISLGWYAGVNGCPAQQIIEDLIRSVSLLLNSKKIIFFGGSGGGFASMFFSYFFKDSLALVWNPQTNIQKYGASGSLKNPKYLVLEETSRLAFNCSPSDLNEKIKANLADLYKKNNQSNRVIYLQNISDKHVKEHLIPFLNQVNITPPEHYPFSDWLSHWLYLKLHDKAKGHSAPERDILLSLLVAVTESPEMTNEELQLAVNKIFD